MTPNEIDPQELERSEDRQTLLYRGEAVAKLRVNWGWTRFYEIKGGGGFGTIRNTGYFFYASVDDFKAAAKDAGE